VAVEGEEAVAEPQGVKRAIRGFGLSSGHASWPVNLRDRMWLAGNKRKRCGTY